MQSAVWDLQVRLFHWSLAISLVAAYFMEGNWRGMHTHLGYTVLLLVSFRLIWGFVGTEHARFANFVCSPLSSFEYLAALVKGKAPHHTGHDPAGALMIVGLLVSITLTGTSGMMLYGMEGNGPLTDWGQSVWGQALPGGTLETIHSYAADSTLILALVHVGGVLLASYRQKENLIRAMINGKKSATPS